jgi:dipeptidyl aminopeptidase/acylaminoacyl peptidase
LTKKLSKKPLKSKDIKAILKGLEPDWKRAKSAKTNPEVTARTGRPLEIADLYALTLVGEPQVSPGGNRVVAEVLTIDKESDEYRSTLWNIPLNGDAPSRLTSGQWSDTSSRWSPDGMSIAFLSNRIDKKPQIFVLPVAGGEAQQITSGDAGISDFAWAPDSDLIAFVRDVAPDKDPGTGADTGDESDTKVITSARYKADGKGFLGDKFSHIFLVSVGNDVEPVQLTEGQFNHSSPAWSPTGDEIAFVANREENWDKTPNNDLWVLDVESKETRKLTDGAGTWRSPAWSPDGSTIAVGGHADVSANDVNPRDRRRAAAPRCRPRPHDRRQLHEWPDRRHRRLLSLASRRHRDRFPRLRPWRIRRGPLPARWQEAAPADSARPPHQGLRSPPRQR